MQSYHTSTGYGDLKICFQILLYNYNLSFAQWIQNTHALAPSATAPGATASTSLTWGGGDLVAVGGEGCFVTYSTWNRGFFGPSHSCIYDSCDGIDTPKGSSICPQLSFDTG
ncbi:Photosystem I P700 chlorophyll a apoprotein A1 [Linum grandiflorum]